MKKKISQFEFAIMETITPEKAKDYKPRTDSEELNIRQQKLLKQVKNLNIGVVVGSKPACMRCHDKKKLPLYDEFDGKLKGSFKCPKCNSGTEPGHWTDNY